MSMVAVAIGGAALVGAGATIYASNQAGNAAQLGYQGAQNSITAQQNAQNQQMLQTQPYTTAGYGALNSLEWGMGIGGTNPQAYQASPTGVQGKNFTFNDFLAYNNAAAPGDTNNYNDAQAQYQQYMAGMYGSDQATQQNFGSKFFPTPANGFGAAPASGGAGAATGGGIAGGGVGNATNRIATPGGQTTMVNSAANGGTSQHAAAGAPGGGSSSGPGFGGYGDLSRPFTANDLNTYLAPNYQWQLQTGLQAAANQYASTGQSGSGNMLTGINDWAQNYAGNAYQQAFNNYTQQQANTYNRLASIAGLGQTAQGQNTTLAGVTTPGISSSLQNAGASLAAGAVGQANAVTGGAGQLANLGMSYYALNNNPYATTQSGVNQYALNNYQNNLNQNGFGSYGTGTGSLD